MDRQGLDFSVARQQVPQQICVFNLKMAEMVEAISAAYLTKVDNAGDRALVLVNMRDIEVAMRRHGRLGPKQLHRLGHHQADRLDIARREHAPLPEDPQRLGHMLLDPFLIGGVFGAQLIYNFILALYPTETTHSDPMNLRKRLPSLADDSAHLRAIAPMPDRLARDLCRQHHRAL